MGFLSNIVKKAAPKIIAATTIGGSKESKTVLKSNVTNPVFDPVYQKFGDTAESTAKIGVAIATAAIGGSLLGKVGSTTPTAGGNAGIGGLLKSASTPTSGKSVGLLDTLTKGLNKVDAFSKTNIGSQLIGTLGKVVTNLATPGGGKPSNVPQQLALQQGTAQSVPETAAQSAVFQGKGIEIKTGSEQTWWDKNKSWAWILAIPGSFIAVAVLFKFFASMFRK